MISQGVNLAGQRVDFILQRTGFAQNAGPLGIIERNRRRAVAANHPESMNKSSRPGVLVECPGERGENLLGRFSNRAVFSSAMDKFNRTAGESRANQAKVILWW